MQMTQPLSHQCGKEAVIRLVILTWANCNSMSCNPNKCKELVIKKKGNSRFYPVVRNIPQHATLDLLGLTFQNDSKFSAHIKAKLCKANKCLDRCCKLRFISTQLIIRSLLQKQDKEIFQKAKPSEGVLTARKEQSNLQS